MATIEKNMNYANFNITYGDDEEPMLVHFEDIIFPAFCSGYRRGKKDSFPVFYFDEVEIKKIDNEYVLVGNYIKDTKYDVRTTVINGRLVSTPATVPTAPYSRFIIFLKNHRMVLVRNEQQSPDIRSFQATVRMILNEYISKENSAREKDNQLPNAFVNIVDIPLSNNIIEVLKEVEKINWIKFRFFPLNNDISPLPFAENVDQEMKRIQSKRAHVQFTSPESKEEITSLIDRSAGLAVATMEVRDRKGNKTKIKQDQFTSSKKIILDRDILPTDDGYIILQAKKDDIITMLSQKNKELYERFTETIKKIKNKKSDI